MASVQDLQQFVKNKELMEQKKRSLEEHVQVLLRDLEYFQVSNYHEEAASRLEKILGIEDQIAKATQAEQDDLQRAFGIISRITEFNHTALGTRISLELNDLLRNLLTQGVLLKNIEKALHRAIPDPVTASKNVDHLNREIREACRILSEQERTLAA